MPNAHIGEYLGECRVLFDSQLRDSRKLAKWLEEPENAEGKDLSVLVDNPGWVVKKSRTKDVIQFLRVRGYKVITSERTYQPIGGAGAKAPPTRRIRRGEKISIYDEHGIQARRKYIHDAMIERYGVPGNFSSFTAKNLEDLWELYDEVFFGGQVAKKLAAEGSTLTFQTTVGGKTKLGGWCRTTRTPGRKHCFFTISFPVGLYKKLFVGGEKALRVNGIDCWDRLSCLQMVLEHESMHMLMQLYNYEGRIRSGPGKTIYDPHGGLFKCMVGAYFGHKDTKHGLLSGEASESLTRGDVTKGMRIQFHDRKKNVTYIAIVDRVNPKTLGVTVTEPAMYRGSRFKVPYSMAQPVGGSKTVPVTPPGAKIAVEVTPIGKPKPKPKTPKGKSKTVVEKSPKAKASKKKKSPPKASAVKLCFLLHTSDDGKYSIYQYTAKSIVIIGSKDDIWDLKRKIDSQPGRMFAKVSYRLKQCSELSPPGIIQPASRLDLIKSLV